MKHYMSALKRDDMNPERPASAVLYKNIGNIYNVFEDYDMGVYFYRKGLEEARSHGDSETVYKLLQNLTAVSLRMGDVAAARGYHDELAREKQPEADMSRYMDGFIYALLLNGEGRHAESIERFKTLAAFAGERKLAPRYACDAYDEIARIQKGTGHPDEAIRYLKLCVEHAEKAGILHLYVNAMESLEALYKEAGKMSEAGKVKDLYLHVKDTVYDRMQLDMARKQQFLYEMEKTERVVCDLKEKERENTLVIDRQRIVMAISVGALLVALLLVYYFHWQKRRMYKCYRALYDLNRELADTHRDSKAQQAKLREICERQSAEIDLLTRRIGDGGDVGADAISHRTGTELLPGEGRDAEGNDKYRNSNLQEDQRDRLAKEISRIMEDEMKFTSQDFSLGYLADMLDSNAKYVSQVINDVYKKNFTTYVNEYRIRLACERLSDFDRFGSYSIRGIGESVGFRSYTSFITAFKKITGISPSVYQRLSAEDAAKGC